MNWNQIAGKWSQVKDDIRQKWGKLTDNDLEVVAGSKDKLIGRIQERYRMAKEEAQRELDEWIMTVGSGQQVYPNESRARRKGV